MWVKTQNKVIVRFPPSPTGFLHIGGARTALFNFLFARRYGGSFLLRIEDTDRERSKKEYEDNILDALAWLGISHDNKELTRQSKRTEMYGARLKRLVDEGKAYLSREEAKGGDRSEVIRFKNPNKTISFEDLIRGEIVFDTTELGDFVIAKSFEEPLYHLAVVVDDLEMAVTHVIRGEDHISNTPRQILLIEAFGEKPPTYGHIPLILAPDRTKLSKRHGAVAVTEYREKGYLPEAVLNYLALLGWNPGTQQEFFTLGELAESFDLSKVQKGGAVFNIEKLNWFNHHYIKKLSPEEKLTRLEELDRNGALSEKIKALKVKPSIVELISERISNFSELYDSLIQGEYDYFFAEPKYEKSQLLWKEQGSGAEVKNRLTEVVKLLAEIPASSWKRDAIRAAIWPYVEKTGRGETLWPFRMSLSGKEKSPDPFTLSEMLGKEKTLRRLATAANLLS